MTKTPQRRGRSHLRGGQNKNKGIGVENIRWSAVILTGVVLLALLSAVMLYSSYYLGGRSIYLMRRLPDGRQTLRRQVWTAPLVWAVCAVAAAAVVLGVGRAIGEAMAIILVAGNVSNMPGLFTPVRFLTTGIISGMAYASVGSLYQQALYSIGLVLFLFIMLINVFLNVCVKNRKEG